MPTPLNCLSALEAVDLLQRRELSAVQLLRACYARIEQRNPTLHAWAAMDKSGALARAEALDRGPITGALHGLPFGVKDLFDTADLTTSYGSPIYQSHRPAADAAVVALCRQAGAVMAGKTVTTEFATFKPAPTRNPHNTAYTPGGSSSGSATAVADHMVPFALGTQTAGSVIRPAAYCGVVGFKPSAGAVPRAGMKSLAESLDTVGWFTRSVEDAGLVGSVLMRDARLLDLRHDAKPLIGMYRSPQWRHTQPETKQAFNRAAAALSRAGAQVREVDLPQEYCALVQIQSDIMAFEISRSLAYERGTHRDQLSAPLTAVLESGEKIDAEQHARNLERAAQAYGRVEHWFEQCDALLTPSASGEPPFADQGTGDPLFCRVWTLFGLPCVHLPFASGPQGLPVGLQLVGRRGSDHRTLAIAAWMHPVLKESPAE
jgi:Asp-tRNA(Asn)/Glu-tRNA(Gln) amidotransferase A subunit family amidase